MPIATCTINSFTARPLISDHAERVARGPAAIVLHRRPNAIRPITRTLVDVRANQALAVLRCATFGQRKVRAR